MMVGQTWGRTAFRHHSGSASQQQDKQNRFHMCGRVAGMAEVQTVRAMYALSALCATGCGWGVGLYPYRLLPYCPRYNRVEAVRVIG